MTRSTLRFSAALLLACLLVPGVAWLVLVCADFAGLENSAAPHPAWKTFSWIMATALTVPPALHLWPDRTHPLQKLFLEGCRAALFSFSVFAVLFIPLAHIFASWLHIPGIMLPLVMKTLAPFLSFPLLCISYAFARNLAPRPSPKHPMPPFGQIFGTSSFLLMMILFLYALAIPKSSSLFPPSFPPAIWALLFFCMRRALTTYGDAGIFPAWGMFCLLHLHWMIMSFSKSDPILLALATPLAVLEIFSSICLLLPSYRRWLN